MSFLDRFKRHGQPTPAANTGPTSSNAPKPSGQTSQQEPSDPYLDIVKMFYFPSEQAIREHILAEIKANSPDRVLVAAGWESFAKPFLTQAGDLAGEYVLTWNEKHSLAWLCGEVQKYRSQGNKVIILSNYPRDSEPPKTAYSEMGGPMRTVSMPAGTSLRLCNTSDATKKVAVYLVGAYTTGYIRSVSHSQARGPTGGFQLQMLVSGGSDPSLLDSERKQLQACTDDSERHRLLFQIAKSLETDPNTPGVARSGGILVA